MTLLLALALSGCLVRKALPDDTDSDVEPGADEDADGDGYSPGEGDCDDTDPATNPGATEVCGDGVDNDCDGGPGSCVVSGDLDPTTAAFAVIWGQQPQDYLGIGVAVLDLDEDGDDDLALVASVRGEVLSLEADLRGEQDLDDAAVVLEAGAWPQALVALGDRDGDGHAEIAVGQEASESGDGAVYVHNAPFTGPQDLERADTIIAGGYGASYLGRHLAAPGDLDGDGLDELYVWGAGEWSGGSLAPDAIYLVPGGSGDDVDAEDLSDRILGADRDDELLATNGLFVGDLDGDGVRDLLFDSARYDLGETNTAVVLGAPSGTVSSADADILVHDTGANGVAAGDLNGDGTPDLVTAGESGYFVFFSPPTGDADTSSADWSATSLLVAIGYADASADTDFSGDGQADLVLSEEGSANPRALVWYGPLLAGSYDSDGADVRLDVAGSERDGIASTIDAVPDVTGDGVPELLIGAKGDDREGGNAGVVYLLSLSEL